MPNYDDEYERRQRLLTEAVETGRVTERDANAIKELCDAFHEDTLTVTRPTWPDANSNLTSYREESTLGNWMYALTRYARRAELTDTNARRLNEISQRWVDGSDDDIDGSLAKSTVRNYQSALRLFYRYHGDNVGIDHTDIAVFEQQDTAIEPRDMLTPEEIQELRDAPTHSRDKAIIDLLLYTGLRNTGLRTLRVRDIDLDNDQYYFNTNADGLKGVHRPNQPRPLLGAKNAVQQWLNLHPHSDDPNAFFICSKPEYNTPTPHEPVSRNTIGRILRSVDENTTIDKPTHPHALRHNMVSICKREYEMDDLTVKFLIGHSPDSNVMESTYAHLTAADYAAKARRAVGTEDETEQSLVPPTCDVCDEPLPDQAKACPRCGTVYTADANAVQQQIEDDLHEGALAADTDAERDVINQLREELQDNEQLQAVVTELLNDEDDGK
jgi:integrase